MRSENNIIEICRGILASRHTETEGLLANYIMKESLKTLCSSGTQWRDAKKELPKCDCKVLVYDELGMVSDAWFLWAKREFVHDGIVSKRVYWQPLPAPPEGV